MPDRAEVLRDARLPFIELLASLDDDQWAMPSLCDGWTVQEVAAHVAWATVDPPHAVVAGLVRARFDVNRCNDENARRWARRGPAAVLEQLRANAARGATPFGAPWPAPVVDAVVHDLDVRRPLGRPREVGEPLLRLTADFLLAARWPLAVLLRGDPRERVRGVRVTATGTTWSYGTGPALRASPETLLLLLAGRTVDTHELDGPGAALVQTSGSTP